LAGPDRHPGPANPDPDQYLFQPNVKLNYFFSMKTSKYCLKNIENNDTYDAVEKDKTMFYGTAGNKSQKFSDFLTRVKLGIGSASKWKVGSSVVDPDP
jgi:hypothetical protein